MVMRMIEIDNEGDDDDSSSNSNNDVTGKL